MRPVARRPRPRPGKSRFSAPALGRTVGSIFGPTGALAGAAAGSLFRTVTGFGDYKVNSNSLTSGIDRLPAFKAIRAGTRITHREYMFDVVTSSVAGAFKIQTIAIQPALLASFPWLSATAENYEEYKLNGAVYEFKSNSYDALASTNTASGTVIMTTGYNVLSPPFTNKFSMEQYQYTCSSKPSVDLLHPVECAKIETPTSVLFTRASTPATGDLRLYDWGNFNIATVGMQGTSVNVGELWVTYDVTLFKPKLGSSVDIADHFILNPASCNPGGANYFGTLATPPIKTNYSDMGTTLSASAGTALDTINWPVGYTGNVLVTYNVNVASLSALLLQAPMGASVTGGVAGLSLYSSGANNSQGPGGSLLLYNQTGGSNWNIFLRITDGGSITFTGGTGAGAPLSGDLYAIALPADFHP